MKYAVLMLSAFLLFTVPGCGKTEAGSDNAGAHAQQQAAPLPGGAHMEKDMIDETDSGSLPAVTDTAIFGGGCFWCIEAVFERLDGVISVEAGYAGGKTEHPTYEQVCSGSTGHAEVARIIFDPARISYADLLEVFWQAHDPTTMNRQGADVGTQYRSAIFTLSDKQRSTAEKSMQAAQKQIDSRIVTEISPLTTFYVAENYHQDYYNRNRNAPYCQVVIRPKLKKLKLE